MHARTRIGPDELALTEVLREEEEEEISVGVRLRVALDVTMAIAEAHPDASLSPRSASSRLRLENVVVGADGVSRAVGDGDTSGAAEVIWEILASRSLAAAPGAPLREVAGDVSEVVEALVARALAREGLERVADLAEALEEAGRGYLDTHEDVRHALRVAERAAARPPAPPDPEPAAEPEVTPAPVATAPSPPAPAPRRKVRAKSAAPRAALAAVAEAAPERADASPATRSNRLALWGALALVLAVAAAVVAFLASSSRVAGSP